MDELTQKYLRHIKGAQSKAAGAHFEKQISNSIEWHQKHRLMRLCKTPEPIRQIGRLNSKGQFLACYSEKAQVDFAGTMIGGKSIRFEAKQTSSDRFAFDRLSKEQMTDLTEHQKLGAYCFVLICFGVDDFYRIPWDIWRNMKEIYGRKYIKASDVQEFKLPCHSGVIKLLSGIVSYKELPDEADRCVACGDYTHEGSQLCYNCQKQLR